MPLGVGGDFHLGVPPRSGQINSFVQVNFHHSGGPRKKPFALGLMMLKFNREGVEPVAADARIPYHISQNVSSKCLVKMPRQNASSKVPHQEALSKGLIKMPCHISQNALSKCIFKMPHQNALS